MSQVVDFMFNNISRIGQDSYNHTQEATMNNAHSSYTLSNLGHKSDKSALQLSTTYPTMNLKGSRQIGPYGHNIDDNSKLMQSKLTNTNCKINLQERSYLTVPYLGRGNVDVGLENALKFGETFKEKKSSDQLNEQSFSGLENYPMQNDLKSVVTNPQHCVEESAVKGWIRGGMPSREIYKNKKFQCN